jgi:hypothetical protein
MELFRPPFFQSPGHFSRFEVESGGVSGENKRFVFKTFFAIKKAFLHAFLN